MAAAPGGLRSFLQSQDGNSGVRVQWEVAVAGLNCAGGPQEASTICPAAAGPFSWVPRQGQITSGEELLLLCFS